MFVKDLQATAFVSLGMPSVGVVGCVVIQVVPDAGGWSGSAVVNIRVGGARPDGTPIPNAALATVPYYNVATKAKVVAGTAITAAGIYAIEAPGLEVVLNYTHTSGSAVIYGNPLDYPLQLLNTA
jgi:hypothetical protein